MTYKICCNRKSTCYILLLKYDKRNIIFSYFSYLGFVEGKKKISMKKYCQCSVPTAMFYRTKLTFVCSTEVLLFVMQLSLFTLAIKKKISILKHWEKSCSDLTVFWTVRLLLCSSLSFNHTNI